MACPFVKLTVQLMINILFPPLYIYHKITIFPIHSFKVNPESTEFEASDVK